MKRIAGWLVVLALLGGAVFAAVGWTRTQGKPEVRFETVKVERGRLVAKVTATGTVSALVTVQVGSQVSGRLQQILVDFNSTVKKGQVIARLDPPLFQAAVEQARANHSAAQGNSTRAKVQAADAKRQYDRSRELAERKLIAPADLDTAQATAEAAQAQVAAAQGTIEQARAALHQAEINFNFTTIVSPINGVVISRNVDVGQTVAASLQAPTLFTIAEDLRKMQVDTNVAEADVGKLKPGMNASFVVDAYPLERFKGTIRQVRNAPQTVQNVVTYDAVIDVDNSALKLKPGMTANVTFVYAEKDGALKVPNAALRFRPPPELGAAKGGRPDGGAGQKGQGRGGKDDDPAVRKVWRLQGATPAQVTVKIGITDGTATEIAEGELKEGDPVITEMVGGEAKGGPPPTGGPGMRRMF
ncbi:MAG: efflux RND transporter periplasmic adaptor subunit [Myxococcales bacterium]|nr:efflux RND transporter periplasmic adaptor subunit [Myxococcales bacterium]